MLRRLIALIVVCSMLAGSMSGCALIIQKGRRSDLERIMSLEDQLRAMRDARNDLEKSLRDNSNKEIDNGSIKLEMKEKGLVITVLAEVLFDSGKAVLRTDSSPVLREVSNMLTGRLSEFKVGIEGHTDNDPIQKSNWKSNWELSVHRALSVLHVLIDNGVSPSRLSVLGFGEYTPVVPNNSKTNKQVNRRVEIVVYPHTSLTKKDVDKFEEYFK